MLLKDSSRFGGEKEEPGVRGGGVKEAVELKAAGGEKVEEEPELKLKCLVKTPGLDTFPLEVEGFRIGL